MADNCIGIVSPGEMGAAVGRSLCAAGRPVLAALGDRSPETIERARGTGIEAVHDLHALVARAAVIVSIVPPAVAADVATGLAKVISSTGATPLVVEANAISPSRADEIARIVEDSGAVFVDGDLIGGPPAPGQPATRLYLSGPHAEEAAAILRTAELRPVVLEGPAMAASSLKMAYAAWTKGSAALLLTVRALARHLGVEDALLAEWADSQPDLFPRFDGAVRRSGRSWRFVAEMEEIAITLHGAGLPAGFGQAAADAYRLLCQLKGVTAPSELEVLERLSGR